MSGVVRVLQTLTNLTLRSASHFVDTSIRNMYTYNVSIRIYLPKALYQVHPTF